MGRGFKTQGNLWRSKKTAAVQGAENLPGLSAPCRQDRAVAGAVADHVDGGVHNARSCSGAGGNIQSTLHLKISPSQDSMFRLAVFTPPPALDAASELRRPRRRGGHRGGAPLRSTPKAFSRQKCSAASIRKVPALPGGCRSLGSAPCDIASVTSRRRLTGLADTRSLLCPVRKTPRSHSEPPPCVLPVRAAHHLRFRCP